MDVSIIIVNYNTKDITYQCIESIKKYTSGLKYEIILIDNNSDDGSKIFFDTVPEIKFIPSNENLGFGKANNLGVQFASGEFVFLLNSDTILFENSIYQLFDFFNQNEKQLNIGVLGASLLDSERSKNYSGGDFPTPFTTYADLIKYYLKIKKKEIPTSNADFYEVEMVTGADMFLKKEMYTKLKGFDEKFFMYYEESDLQHRIKSLGYKNYILNSVKIIHLEGMSFNKKKENHKRIITQRSKNRYFAKNYKWLYPVYILVDGLLNVFRLCNLKYTWSENVSFIKENIKSYSN